MHLQKTYKSKIGIGLSLFMALVLVGTTIPMMLEKEIVWLGIGINAATGLFIVYTFNNTKYTIDGSIIHIKCGFLYKKDIEIQDIKKIEESRSPLSSPAASMDRLELLFNKYDSVLISPKEKSEFIDELLKINPSIEVKYGKK